jgi:hypothetical protein
MPDLRPFPVMAHTPFRALYSLHPTTRPEPLPILSSRASADVMGCCVCPGLPDTAACLLCDAGKYQPARGYS